VILDASALLAYLHRERGFEQVRQALLGGAVIGAVNLAEVASVLCARGIDAGLVADRVRALGLHVEPFLEDDALAVGMLRVQTESVGLSLADRACLALARRLGLPVLTSDQRWAELDAGAEIRLLR
jgi:PIN domain nuclease of toxin-antitoxin system